MSNTIKVPDIDHPTLCYREKRDPPGAMGRCDRPKGHLGPHSWALADLLAALEALVAHESTCGLEGRCGDCEFIVAQEGHAPGCFVGRVAGLIAQHREPQP